MRCWGSNSFGQLGYGHTRDIGDDETPASAGDVNVGGPVMQVAAGGQHTCALLTTRKVRCWGLGNRGILGYGNLEWIGDNEPPSAAGDVDVGGPVKQITTGKDHTCALLENGKVRCWGSNFFAQLGSGNKDDVGFNQTPASAGDVDIGGEVQQISAGLAHTCALLTAGTVRCWGWGFAGELGYGNTHDVGDDETPASVGDVEVGGQVRRIATGSGQTCALLTSGAMRCWGSGGYGMLGYGNTNNVGDGETPASAGDVEVGGAVQQVAAGVQTCALLTTGAMRCWGWGAHGELGYGNTNNIGDETPASAGDVDVGGPVREIAAGAGHTCALLTTGKVRCWGGGDEGPFGYGTTNRIGDDETPASAGDMPL